MIAADDTVAQRNFNFSFLTPAEKRVAIARDVMQQVLLKRFVPEAGCYVQPSSYTAEEKVVQRCNVCAIGAVAVALLGTDEGHKACRGIRNSAMLDFFDYTQLREMESAFEESAYRHLDDDGECQRDYVELWEEHNLSQNSDGPGHDDTRLLLIFANIINNQGTFCPETLENEIESFKLQGPAYWYSLAGLPGGQEVLGQGAAN